MLFQSVDLVNMKVGFLVAGEKGFHLLDKVHLECNIGFVSSYQSKGIMFPAQDSIKSICTNHQYCFLERHDLKKDILSSVDLVFVAGWQFLIEQPGDNLVVFHDSLLPKYRGFSPTVTALINGEPRIGVTALKPCAEVDAGDIYAQKSLDIQYPIKINDVYALLTNLYAEIALELIQKFRCQRLITESQNEVEATYSIWRNADDYFIDWWWDAEKIKRFVDAVGYPYEGARTLYQNREIYIDNVEVIQDIFFAERHPGKFWSLQGGYPQVVCGAGMIQLLAAREKDGSPVTFNRLRERLVSKRLF